MNINADQAAMKPLLKEVVFLLHNYSVMDCCNPSAVYSNGRKTRRALETARKEVASSIGADADEIYFTSGATEAINWVMKSVPKNIITTRIEHKAIYKNAFDVDTDKCVYTVPIDLNGRIITECLDQLCTNRKILVIGWVNNEIGTIQPVEEIIDICHKNETKVFIDATQAIGHIPINVHELDVDYLCGSFGKLGGLSGCGFLYCKKGEILEPFILGGGQEHGMRASTENILGIFAGAIAITNSTNDINIKMSQTQQKRDMIISELLKIPKSHLNGSMGNRVCNNINISFEGIDGESLVLQLDTRGIQCSTGSACNSQNIEPSHVLKAIGLSNDLARSSIRITIGDDITDEEINYLIKNVKECVEQLRSMSPKWKEIIDLNDR